MVDGVKTIAPSAPGPYRLPPKNRGLGITRLPFSAWELKDDVY